MNKSLDFCRHQFKAQGFLRRCRDPIRVFRIENRVPRFIKDYHRVPGMRENKVPRIREIGSLQIHSGYLTFSLKNLSLRCSYAHTASVQLHL